MSAPHDTSPSGTAPPSDLIDAAWEAHAHAYVPYSRFAVGAALRTPDGRTYAGANVENASYGLGRCAEQSAIQAMASAGARTFEEIVVVSDADEPATPCGACRQILFEFAADATVWLVAPSNAVQRHTVRSLLPYGFTLRPER